MATFTPLQPLKDRILEARTIACQARAAGDAVKAQLWDDRVDRLLDMLPR